MLEQLVPHTAIDSPPTPGPQHQYPVTLGSWITTLMLLWCFLSPAAICAEDQDAPASMTHNILELQQADVKTTCAT